MAFNPKATTKEHILHAIAKIEKEGMELIPSTRWLVEINGKEYPPKEVMRYAHEQMNGEKIWQRGGGEATNKYLKIHGFKMFDMKGSPVEAIISKYKNHLQKDGLGEEIYKWELIEKYQGKPNLDADNFFEEVSSIKFSNLLYEAAVRVMKHIASERPEPLSKLF